MFTNIEFSQINLPTNVLEAVTSNDWKYLTQIQAESIPLARSGCDLVAQAKTGSGKTAAFSIPLIESSKVGTIHQALVLAPTRELALQVSEEIKWLQGNTGLSIVTVYGGVNIETQSKSVSSAEIIVGTPGRVIDLCKRGVIKIEALETLVLDEADRMLDMGFFPDVLWVISGMTQRKQTLLFSATFPQEILDGIDEFMDAPEYVMTDSTELEIPDISQYYSNISRRNKFWAISRILGEIDGGGQTLIFCNTKRMVDLLAENLQKRGLKIVGLHGDMPQNKRERIMNQFKEGSIELIAATDVASRGLHVEGVSLVINYDLPDDLESYIHRIGRTGRMGSKGTAWSLITKDERQLLTRLVSTYNLDVENYELADSAEENLAFNIKKVVDWGDEANVFGMVPLEINLGKTDGYNNYSLIEFIRKEISLSDLSIGEITVYEEKSLIEIHTSKVEYVIPAINNHASESKSLSCKLASHSSS